MIYFIEAVGLDRVKIGRALNDEALVGRFEAVQCGCPVEEQALHERFAASRVRGEWYVLSTVDLPMLRPWVHSFACTDCGARIAKKTAQRHRTHGGVARCRACVMADPSINRGRPKKPRRPCGGCAVPLEPNVRGAFCRRCFASTKLWALGVAARTPASAA